jgi:hypothetical protein
MVAKPASTKVHSACNADDWPSAVARSNSPKADESAGTTQEAEKFPLPSAVTFHGASLLLGEPSALTTCRVTVSPPWNPVPVR